MSKDMLGAQPRANAKMADIELLKADLTFSSVACRGDGVARCAVFDPLLKGLLVKHPIICALASATLLAAAGSSLAQTTSIPAAPDAAVGGQASTQTPAGVPNPTQRPDGANPASRTTVRSEARMENRNNANTTTPKGESSTTTNNQPNAAQQTGAMARAEVKPTRNELKPQMGKAGERPDVPTNPKDKTGTPQ